MVGGENGEGGERGGRKKGRGSAESLHLQDCIMENKSQIKIERMSTISRL